MKRTLRCRRCQDVIGVYEPMIVLDEGRARTTSRAAERDLEVRVQECYHEACFAQTCGEDPAP
jgi:hypothetical protein